jgi:hypothetical protein
MLSSRQRGRDKPMRGFRAILLAALLVSSGGCLRTLHPLYTDQDLLYAPSLIGRWTEADSTATWEFSPAGEKAYRLLYVDEKKRTGAFEAHLLDLRGWKFLDLFPEEPPDTIRSDFYKLHFLPVHTFFLVRQVEPVLQMAAPEEDWLKRLLEREPQAIAHEILDGEVVLTAATPQLQELAIRLANSPGAFGDWSTLRKATAEGTRAGERR